MRCVLHNVLTENLLFLIRNSVGSSLFKTFYVDDSYGWFPARDVCQGGQLSCALFVSRICLLSGLLRIPCVTVGSLLKEMASCYWKKADKGSVGSIIIWEPRRSANGEIHRHAGFLIDGNKCVSNSPFKGVPIEHDLFMTEIYGEERRIEAFFVHPYLF